MKKFLSTTFIIIFLYNLGFTQGKVRGKITDENGESLIGVTVFMKSTPNSGAVTDFDGIYSLIVSGENADSLIAEYIGFETIREEIKLAKGEVLIKDFTMYAPTLMINEVVITAKQERAKAYYMENIKKKSAVSLDYISSETMKKIGDNNVVAAVTRVTGVSSNGGFITVRGIGDRYIHTAINGAQIPTLDPFTNNIKLDIIPASLVDNIVVSKTASPDLPGDFSAAYISVETKDYPDKLTFNVESTVGYNANIYNENILANNVSNTDWLGYDNGFRDRNHAKFVNFNRINDYDVMVAAGLGDYYKNLGITKNWDNARLPLTKELYFNLGLVELGLLQKGSINDEAAIKAARSLFESKSYRIDAYRKINQAAVAENGTFSSNWTTFSKIAPINNSHSLSFGNQVKLFGNTLGFIAGIRYGQSTLYDSAAVNDRARFSAFDKDLGGPLKSEFGTPRVARYTNGWSAVANLSYKIKNNSTSILFMPNFIGVNNLREGTVLSGNFVYDLGVLGSSQFYEQRKQLVYQVNSEQYIPSIKLRINLNGSYTNGKSIAPDFKRYRFFNVEDGSLFHDGTAFNDDPLSRDFRYLGEDLLDTKISFEFPLGSEQKLIRKIKFGVAYKKLSRKYDQYNYALSFDEDSPFALRGLAAFFDTSSFSFIPGKAAVGKFYANPDFDPNHTYGSTVISAIYAMTDYNFTSRLRLSGGLRAEYTDLYVDSDIYIDQKLKKWDIRRNYDGALISNPGVLTKLNLLPSANFIYKLKDSETHPINLRLNYSQTLARPSLREYSESIVYDFEYRADIFGNSNLKLVNIDNYDLRMEAYFPGGDNVSFSIFNKNFKNHIEVIDLNTGLSWSNSNKSYARGIEIEGKKVFGNLTLAANVSLVKSEANVVAYSVFLDVASGFQTFKAIDSFSRVMYGQSPLVANGIVTYELPKYNFIFNIAYNYQAPRLVQQGSRYEGLLDLTGNIPDIYEMPRNLVDVKISKRLFKHFNLSLNIRDLLNSPIRRSYQFVDKEGKSLDYPVDFERLKFGTNYQLSIGYQL